MATKHARKRWQYVVVLVLALTISGGVAAFMENPGLRLALAVNGNVFCQPVELRHLGQGGRLHACGTDLIVLYRGEFEGYDVVSLSAYLTEENCSGSKPRYRYVDRDICDAVGAFLINGRDDVPKDAVKEFDRLNGLMLASAPPPVEAPPPEPFVTPSPEPVEASGAPISGMPRFFPVSDSGVLLQGSCELGRPLALSAEMKAMLGPMTPGSELVLIGFDDEAKPIQTTAVLGNAVCVAGECGGPEAIYKFAKVGGTASEDVYQAAIAVEAMKSITSVRFQTETIPAAGCEALESTVEGQGGKASSSCARISVDGLGTLDMVTFESSDAAEVGYEGLSESYVHYLRVVSSAGKQGAWLKLERSPNLPPSLLYAGKGVDGHVLLWALASGIGQGELIEMVVDDALGVRWQNEYIAGSQPCD